MDETAMETRSGVDLTLSYNAGMQKFIGTIHNTTASTVTNVRVEIHLSSGKELGPTPRTSLEPDETKEVTLDASGQRFTWYNVHIELGSGSS
ncbi:MAG: hypothetical protein OXD43_11615 [Bacteroidetes bacterium]|nr:hypothetical protein [Bacteroidota bacterium]